MFADFWSYANELIINFDRYKVLAILVVIAVAFIVVHLGSFILTRLFGRAGDVYQGRVQTMLTLALSALRYSVYIISLIIALNICGVQTGALLAGAGVVGLAVGFGAKNLVEDVISGFFILFEDQFSVGDYITTSGVSGIVENVGLRVTQLKDLGGQLHFLPNGKITQVTNHSRGSLEALVDVGIAYSEDHNRAMRVLERACQKLVQERADLMLKEPKVLGIVSLSASQVQIRISAGAVPLQKEKVERELRKRAKEAMESEGIQPG